MATQHSWQVTLKSSSSNPEFLSRQNNMKTGLPEDLVEIFPFWEYPGIQSQSTTPQGERIITNSRIYNFILWWILMRWVGLTIKQCQNPKHSNRIWHKERCEALFTKARVEGWPWAAASLPPSHPLTPPPQQNWGEGRKRYRQGGHSLITITGQTETTWGKWI